MKRFVKHILSRVLRYAARDKIYLIVSAICLLAMAPLLNAFIQYRIGNSFFISNNVPLFVYGSVVMFFVLLTASAIFSNAFLGSSVVAAALVLLTFADKTKYSIRMEHVFPSDLVFFFQADDLADMYQSSDLRPQIGLMAVFIAAGVFATFLTHRFRKKKLRVNRRAAVRLGTLVFAIALMLIVTFPIRSANLGNLPQIGYQYIAWNQIRNYNSNGFVVSFVSNLKEATMTKPEGYSREKVAEIVSRYQEQAKAANADRADLENEDIDIVFIMNESFSDPDRFKDIYPYTGISDELTPNLHRIADMAASGFVYSPRYGGGTANIEFEALTGFSTYFLGYAYPFQSMLPVMDSFPSIARVLGDYGSETLGLHPFGETMYRRNAVYPILGFDAFCGSLDFHHFRHDRGSLYISDQSAYEEVMDYLNGVRPIEAAEDADGGSGADGGSSQNPFDSWRAGASDAADFDTGDTGDAGAATDAPEGVDADGVDGIVDSEGAAGTEDAAGAGSKFITLITMQNHPAYGSQYRDHSFRSTAMDNVTYDTRLKINDYMELVHSSDEALGAFIDWAAGREKKTMVVFWGDHLPGIYDNVFFVDPALGYETPFFIYTNFDQRSSDLGSVSPNYISTLTLDSLGAKKPAFDYLLDELKAEVPILTAPYWEEAPPEETQAFSDYRIIEYDMMAGAGYSDDLGFFEVDRD